ncbi:hypothetical protein LOTGIDRAFT_165288 [Lottia gigantea]|uniref:Reverse transcriptase zinc-binding domain-containing protein n=1 Tax=Lottia gigantea TaxID=225164 RepID=V4BJZ9_LOTGI|nr:hypothetical protein LOTGIDRAFT_165288 [Lottia gigantea]ESO88874.1 hypothetical protein LOTGIDRAFT_165288 [Lottia gigantea]
MGVTDSPFCSVCREKIESIKHLLWDCPYSHKFWENVINWANLVSAKGQPCKSAKLRLKTRSEDWVVVETEWSCYLNPWSNQVDLIFSKHAIISEPSNTDIFREKTSFNKRPNNPEEVKQSQVSSFQKKILKILKQTVDVTSSSSLTVSKVGYVCTLFKSYSQVT